MERTTWALRGLLVLIMVILLPLGLILYEESGLLAEAWPEYAHLQMPTYWSVVGGLAPFVGAVALMFRFLALVDRGEAFSAATVTLLRRASRLIAAFAVYFLGWIVWFDLAFGQLQPGLLVMWFGLEVAALFCLAVAALLARLFSAALAMRADVETLV